MKDAPRIAILDTNVLLLMLAGETDPSLLRSFKRVSSFAETDLDLLAITLSAFRYTITTPHVLAEVSNFVDQAPLYRRDGLIAALRRYVEQNAEHYEQAKQLVAREESGSLPWLILAYFR